VEATPTADYAEIRRVGGNREPVILSKLSVFVSVIRRSGPHVVEASLVPTALFYCFLVVVGLRAAYAVALLWLYIAVCRRLVRGRPVPPLLVLAAIGVTVRTTVSIASGSSFLYFAQPAVTSVVMGGVFLISVCIGRPMVERLALEFWPLTPEMINRPAVSRLLRNLTFFWAGVNVAIGATNLMLLLWLSLPTYVAMRQVASLGITTIGIAITIDRSVRTARREGFGGIRRSGSARSCR
jgi:intracellular septation protein A